MCVCVCRSLLIAIIKKNYKGVSAKMLEFNTGSESVDAEGMTAEIESLILFHLSTTNQDPLARSRPANLRFASVSRSLLLLSRSTCRSLLTLVHTSAP